MHFKMSSAIYFNLDHFKILSSGNGPYKTLWKNGEIAHFEQFHLFPQCFPKAFFQCFKMSIYEGKGYN